MNSLNLNDVREFVNTHIVEFHRGKIASLDKLSLHKILKKKNPYLFRAKNLLKAQDLVEGILDAHISSSEEELFGQFLEKLALFVARQTCEAQQSSRRGVDIEFINRDTYYIVQIKSGPNWGNSSQQARLEQELKKAVAEVQYKVDTQTTVQPVLGICYGKTRTAYLRGYLKVVGQNFWYLISENEHLYTDIIEPIGYRAKQHNDDFLQQRAQVINLFTQEFLADFCDNGIINWEKLVEFNSGNLDLPDFLSSEG